MAPPATAGVLTQGVGGPLHREIAVSQTVEGVLLAVAKPIALERSTQQTTVATPVLVPEMDPSAPALPVDKFHACLETRKLPTMACTRMNAVLALARVGR